MEDRFVWTWRVFRQRGRNGGVEQGLGGAHSNVYDAVAEGPKGVSLGVGRRGGLDEAKMSSGATQVERTMWGVGEKFEERVCRLRGGGGDEGTKDVGT